LIFRGNFSFKKEGKKQSAESASETSYYFFSKNKLFQEDCKEYKGKIIYISQFRVASNLKFPD
jgi:NurA-like 5'-3' nuclease